MRLSKSVNVTNTSFIRAAVAERVKNEGLDGPPVELVRFHVLVFCTGGTGRHMVDFEDHELSRGDAMWIRPGQVHRWSSTEDGFDADVLVFESAAIPDLPVFERLLGETAVAKLDGNADRLEEQLKWISADLAETGDEAIAAAVVSVVLRVFARCSENEDTHTENTSRRRLASAFVDSVDQSIGQRSVTWHAHQVGASTRSIARATIEALGQRPKEVIDGRVILEARRRLAWSSDDVATIARALRFSDSSNFTKYFRSHTGTSPSAFRDAGVASATPR